jgi:hypothetical protein
MTLQAIALEAAQKFSQNNEVVAGGGLACMLGFLGLVEGWAMEQGQNYDYAKAWSRWFFGGVFALEELRLLSTGQFEAAAVLGITFAVGAGVHHVPPASLSEN